MSRLSYISKLISIFTILFLASCSQNTYNVIKIDENATALGHPGFYYSLPRNAISIDITVTKTKMIAGPYAKYASKYLGIKNANETNSVSYEITDVKMNLYSEPDPEHFYFVDISKYRSISRNTLLMRLSESGLLLEINDNSSLPISDQNQLLSTKKGVDYSETFKFIAEDNLKIQIDTIIEKQEIDTMIVEKTIVRKSLVEKTLEEKAKEAADFIAHIKEQRLDIITGAQEVAYSDATIRLMNDELLKLEKEYMRLFIGANETQTYQYRYTYTPESQIFNAQIPLFKFSKYVGVVNEDFDGGQTVYIKVNRSKNTIALSNFASQNINSKPVKTPNGFFYRIPETAKFSVMHGIDQIAEASFLISQFGVITMVPSTDASIQFYPNTGGIRKVELK